MPMLQAERGQFSLVHFEDLLVDLVPELTRDTHELRLLMAVWWSHVGGVGGDEAVGGGKCFVSAFVRKTQAKNS